MSTQPTPSLKAIADAAGVSKTTVSLALRNHRSIGEATRKRIQELAAQMGYRNNPFVSALLAAVSRSQALPTQAPLAFVSDETPADLERQPRRRLYWQHAEARAAELGYRMDRFLLGPDGLGGRRLSDVLRARGILGVVVGIVRERALLDGFDFAEFACASIDRQSSVPELHCTENDGFSSAFHAYARLAERGYRRIGLCMDIGSDRGRQYRCRGALYAFHAEMEWGDPIPPLEPARWEADDFAAWAKKHRPDAIVTVNSEVLSWLKAMKWRVPADVGYVNLAVPPDSQLESGMRNDARVLASGAVDLVDAQLRRNERGLPDKPKRMAVVGNWYEGRTLRPAKAVKKHPARATSTATPRKAR